MNHKTKKFDINKIKSDYSIVDVVSNYIELRKNGIEYIANCPFHDDKKPSLTISPAKDFYHCFTCDAHGDQIDFVKEFCGISFSEACQIITGESDQIDIIAPVKRQVKKLKINDPYEGIKAITPIPGDVPIIEAGKQTPQLFNPKRADDLQKKHVKYTPPMVFPYKNIDGDLIGYVLRVEFGKGKTTPTILWCEMPDGKTMFSHYAFKEPRSFYGIENINNDLPVLIVEGEKCRDVANRLFSDLYICLCWNGGTNAVNKSDFSPLKGKDVTIWPDNDEGGYTSVYGKVNKQGNFVKGAANYALIAGAKSVKCLDILSDTIINKSVAWDIADAETDGMTPDDINALINENSKPFELKNEQENTTNDTDQYQPLEHENYSETNVLEGDIDTVEPFKILGYQAVSGTGALFHVYSNIVKDVVSFSTKRGLINVLETIAPLRYWRDNFAMNDKDKPSIDQSGVMDFMVQNCTRKGFYNVDKYTRGRGAWLDDNRVIFHTGKHCYIDGEQTEPDLVESKYSYPCSEQLIKHPENPATNEQANQLIELAGIFSWQSGLSASLLAGWCVIAPVCGILGWRPHIWISGASGSGKSTVLKNLIQPLLGSIALNSTGDTSEPAIRQTIGRDARPITLDEAEPGEYENKNMKAVLKMLRSCSEGGELIKGSSAGRPLTYTLRSCACLCSINTSLSDSADISRFSNLVMTKDKQDVNSFNNKLENLNSTINDEYANSMLARTLKYLPVLLTNIKTFKKVLNQTLRDSRQADQLSVLLAGCYLCYSVKEISLEVAKTWIEKNNFDDHRNDESESDENQLLNYLLTSSIHYQDESGMMKESSIGNLILLAEDPENNKRDAEIQAADKALKNIGIVAQFDFVLISNTSNNIKKLLKNTRWVSNWRNPLKNIKGCIPENKAKYFSPGIVSKYVKIPITVILGNVH